MKKSITLFIIAIIPIIYSFRTISGIVREEGSHEPISGVSVLFKGTTNGVSTDVDGCFEIRTNSSADTILVFSHVSHIAREINVSKGNIHVVYMRDNTSEQINNYIFLDSYNILDLLLKYDDTGNTTKTPMSPLARNNLTNS